MAFQITFEAFEGRPDVIPQYKQLKKKMIVQKDSRVR